MSKTRLEKLYGITETEWQKMYDAQKGVCAICGCHQRFQKLAVDHNHKTKKVRGLLCMRCNRGLGWFFDSQQRLQAAADYLKRTNE
jgi:hypothetical protein